MRSFFDIDRFREIIETLTRSKSRSILTGFGVFWGIFMLLTLFGGGQGLQNLLKKDLEGFATNSGFIATQNTSMPYKGFKAGRSWDLSFDDIEILKASIPEIDVATGQITIWGANKATLGTREVDCALNGVYPDYAKVNSPNLKYGRFINDIDIAQSRKVCVLGKEIYEQLFPEGGDPCGQSVKYGEQYYMVVGVDSNKDVLTVNAPAEQSLFVPLTVLQKIYNYDGVGLICLTAKEGCEIKKVLDDAKAVLSRVHTIHPDDPAAVLCLNTWAIFNTMNNMFKGISLLIWLVGFGTLLAATIGVSNIMMVTVKERTTEIGIRRAIGATPKMILGQIISESIILTMGAGMIGIIFSVGVLALVENIVAMSSGGLVQFQVSFSFALLAVLILTILGALSGMAPAARAMKIKPVDAMRDE